MKVVEAIMGLIALVLMSVVALTRFLLSIAVGIIGFSLGLIILLSPALLLGWIVWLSQN